MATDLFKLFDGRSGDRIARNNELIWAFSMVRTVWVGGAEELVNDLVGGWG